MIEKYIRQAIATNSHFQGKTLHAIAEEILNKQDLIITAINPYSIDCLNKANVDLSEFEFVFIDGISLCKIIEIFYKDKIERISMDNSSLLKPIFEISNDKSFKICIVGGSEKEAKLASENIGRIYPKINFALVSSGYFKDANSLYAVQQRIASVQPEIVLSSMGCVKQELFLLGLKELGFRGVGFTCGAFIRQTALNLKYYPKVINDFNLRWLYRIWRDPKLLGRYLISYPFSLVKILRGQ